MVQNIFRPRGSQLLNTMPIHGNKIMLFFYPSSHQSLQLSNSYLSSQLLLESPLHKQHRSIRYFKQIIKAPYWTGFELRMLHQGKYGITS